MIRVEEKVLAGGLGNVCRLLPRMIRGEDAVAQPVRGGDPHVLIIDVDAQDEAVGEGGGLGSHLRLLVGPVNLDASLTFLADEVIDPGLAIGDGNPAVGSDPGGASVRIDELGEVGNQR